MIDLLIKTVKIIKDLLEISTETFKTEQVKLRSFSECPECGERINNGYFKIEKLSLKPIIISYETFHNMDIHCIYDKEYGAVDTILGDLLQENENKSSRDQLSYREIEAQIKTYSLEELFNFVNEKIQQ